MILIHSQTTNFRLFQTERVCRRYFKLDKNGRKFSKSVENTVEKDKLLKDFTEDIFKFVENGTEFSRWVEYAVRKGEIACQEQFLLFPQCFQKTFTADM